MNLDIDLFTALAGVVFLCLFVLFIFKGIRNITVTMATIVRGMTGTRRNAEPTSSGPPRARPTERSRRTPKPRNPLVVAAFVACVLGALTLHAFYGWMDIFTVGDLPPRAVRPINSLTSGLDSLLGQGAAGLVFAILTILLTYIAWNRAHRSVALQAMQRTASRPLPDEERTLVKDMVAGVTAQIDHEADLARARQRQPAHVRLELQVPLRERTAMRGWFGGAPSLPPGVDWPVGTSGKPQHFLAQFDCAALPPGIWNGLGPRQGWLSFFIGDENDASVLHTQGPGDFCTPPRSDRPEFFKGQMFGSLWDETQANQVRWPIDIIEVREGAGAEAARTGYSGFASDRVLRKALYAESYSLLDPRFAPFDWQSLVYLVMAAGTAPRRRLAFLQRRLGAGTVGTQPAEAEQNEADLLQTTIRALGDLEAALRDKIGDPAPTDAHIQHVYQTITSLPAPRTAGTAQDVSLLSLESPPEQEVWHYEYVALLIDHCQSLHARAPDTTPPRIWDTIEGALSDMARYERGLVGALPNGYVHGFDVANDVVLLELPTSGFMKWQWGDVYNLVITTSKKNLADADFAGVRAHVTN